MKKVILLASIFAILATLMAACNASSQSTAGDTTSNTDSSESSGSLSKVNKILVGTLKLEETDQAVTAEEAATLLPLWQAYRSLSNSDTAAEAEVEALLKQIENTMRVEQVKAIDEMNLTSDDMLALMQSLGGGMIRGGTPDPNSTPVFEFRGEGFQDGDGPTFDFQGGSGGPPERSFGGGAGSLPPGGGAVIIGGGPMGDAGGEAGLGGGPFMQGTPDPSMQATAQARFSNMAEQANPLLLELLINNLENRASE